MTDDEKDELGRLAGELEDSAARLPTRSHWRARLLQEARILRGAAQLPGDDVGASGLRLIHGEAV